mgnify:CR=1 FL=1
MLIEILTREKRNITPRRGPFLGGRAHPEGQYSGGFMTSLKPLACSMQRVEGPPNFLKIGVAG